MAPRHSGLTETPVRPRILFCMAMVVRPVLPWLRARFD
jgi:hypothetical protein